MILSKNCADKASLPQVSTLRLGDRYFNAGLQDVCQPLLVEGLEPVWHVASQSQDAALPGHYPPVLSPLRLLSYIGQ